VTGQEAGEVYDTVSHLSSKLRLAQAERDLHMAKYEEALKHLRGHDPKMAHAIDSSDYEVS